MSNDVVDLRNFYAQRLGVAARRFIGRGIRALCSDVLGRAYEYLIKQFADDSGHTAQEFYTNRTLVHLMTQILEPKAGDRVYDPTVGTGGMLISALAEVRRRGGDPRSTRACARDDA